MFVYMYIRVCVEQWQSNDDDEKKKENEECKICSKFFYLGKKGKIIRCVDRSKLISTCSWTNSSDRSTFRRC